jgi:hypothetical protein
MKTLKKNIAIAVTLLLMVSIYPANADIKAGETLCSKKLERFEAEQSLLGEIRRYVEK